MGCLPPQKPEEHSHIGTTCKAARKACSSCLAAQNTGANILAGLGSCYNANGMSSEMMVIQAEWLKAAKYLSRGIRTDYFDEGIESIKEQGPGGNFLMDDLTLKLLRSDEFLPGRPV